MLHAIGYLTRLKSLYLGPDEHEQLQLNVEVTVSPTPQPGESATSPHWKSPVDLSGQLLHTPTPVSSYIERWFIADCRFPGCKKNREGDVHDFCSSDHKAASGKTCG